MLLPGRARRLTPHPLIHRRRRPINMIIHKDLSALGDGAAQNGGVDEGLSEVGFGGAGQAHPFFTGGVEIGNRGVEDGLRGREGGAGEGGAEDAAEGGLDCGVELHVAHKPSEGVGC